MAFVCPECGGRELRLSRTHGVVDSLGKMLGIYPIRCSGCGMRFRRRIASLLDVLYTKCPRCGKTELTSWSEEYFHPPLSYRLKILIGARRKRCNYCRYNFVSWRLTQSHPRPGK